MSTSERQPRQHNHGLRQALGPAGWHKSNEPGVNGLVKVSKIYSEIRVPVISHFPGLRRLAFPFSRSLGQIVESRDSLIDSARANAQIVEVRAHGREAFAKLDRGDFGIETADTPATQAEKIATTIRKRADNLMADLRYRIFKKDVRVVKGVSAEAATVALVAGAVLKLSTVEAIGAGLLIAATPLKWVVLGGLVLTASRLGMELVAQHFKLREGLLTRSRLADQRATLGDRAKDTIDTDVRKITGIEVDRHPVRVKLRRDPGEIFYKPARLMVFVGTNLEDSKHNFLGIQKPFGRLLNWVGNKLINIEGGARDLFKKVFKRTPPTIPTSAV